MSRMDPVPPSGPPVLLSTPVQLSAPLEAAHEPLPVPMSATSQLAVSLSLNGSLTQ